MKKTKKIRWNRLYVFPIVAALALTQWACGDGFATGGAGGTGGDINVTGDSNNVCVITADAADDNESVSVDCPTGMNPPQAESPENPGTSQNEPVPE